MKVLYSFFHSRRPSLIVKMPSKTDALYSIFRGYRPSPIVKRPLEADVMYSFFYSFRLSPIVKSPSKADIITGLRGAFRIEKLSYFLFRGVAPGVDGALHRAVFQKQFLGVGIGKAQFVNNHARASVNKFLVR